MCMKDRFSKMGKTWVRGLCLMVTCGLTYSSCSDDYDLPDTKPSYLGASIYSYLKTKTDASGKPMYSNVVRLIDSLKYREVLDRTGSKTMFVASDDAYQDFFANNPWGVKSFDDLSTSQMKVLLNGSMLDNAYLREMLGTLAGGTKNMCLRQTSSLSLLDTLPFYRYDDDAIPHTLSVESEELGFDYWARFREPGKGIYLVSDNTVPLMTHFLEGQMGEKNITVDDVETIVGRTFREPNETNPAFIYGAKVVDGDVTCLNGYVHQLDKVLVTPGNMAEVLRTNGQTNIFSHMLERFAVPVYNRSLTEQFKTLYPMAETDSVFVKRYLSDRSQGNNTYNTKPKGTATSGYLLSFDPGWNTYRSTSSEAQEVDMAAMFVPSDEVFKAYFLPNGAGEYLMNAFAVKPNTEENLYENIDQIPLNVVTSIINNLMKISFNNSVPSKYISVMNDARDPMFSSLATVEDFKQQIDTVLLANNGAIYVMKQVYTPAAQAAVSAPTLVEKNLSIANWAIHADDKAVTNPSNAPLHSYFNAYLLAMSSRFSLFLPTNEAFTRYYDPISHALPSSSAWRIYSFKEPTRGNMSTNGPDCQSFTYDPKTGQMGSRGTTVTATVRNNRLADILNSHIIVHEGDETTTGIMSGNEYFVTKAGNAVKVTGFKTDVDGQLSDQVAGFHVQGAWQLERDSFCTVQKIYDRRREKSGYGNGMTYIIDRPIQHTLKSVYNVLSDNNSESEDNEFSEFYELCNVDRQLLENIGIGEDAVTSTDKNKEINKYMIFTVENTCVDQNVRFFNSYRYTVYVPTNEAIQEAYKSGLPTWMDVNKVVAKRDELLQNASESEQDAIRKEYNEKAKLMVTCIINFVKYHFQDASIFNDKNPIALPEDLDDGYETACVDNTTNRYIKVRVASDGNHTLKVYDRNGKVCPVIDANSNIMTRDMELNGSSLERATSIETSSYAVVHQIDGYLNFMDTSKYGSFKDMLENKSLSSMFSKQYSIKE